jgi:hypothetical protein
MYIACLAFIEVYCMCIQGISSAREAEKNLQAAQKELRSRAPRVAGLALVLEVVVVVSISYVLVGLFA